MEIGIVTYGEQHDFDKIFKKYFPNAKILVLNNKKGSAKAPQIQGSNTNYEFSGYLELSDYFSNSGPIGNSNVYCYESTYLFEDMFRSVYIT